MESMRVPVDQERKYTTISIPTPLFKDIERVIEGTSFRSATEFIVFVTRIAIAGDQGTLVERLRKLGYTE